jgi:hypothetical protein
MSTIAKLISPIITFKDSAHVVSWNHLAAGDDGTPLEMPGSSDRSAQVTGTFGAGGTVVIEGSNDGVNYATLTDPQGNLISITSAKIEAIMELVRYIRPRVTVGDGTTDLSVAILVMGRR